MISGIGGPSRIRHIGRLALAVEGGVLALVLLSCGAGDPAPRAAPTPAQRLQQEPDAGDEQPPAIAVRLRVTDERLTVRPRRVAAFLPLRFVLDNRRSTRATLFRVPGRPLVRQPAGEVAVQPSPGERPGRLRISAGRGRSAVLRVVPGG